MRKLPVSLLVLGLVAVVLGAGTFAYFSDVETSQNNVFAAGTVDIEVTDASGSFGPYNIALTALPGETYWYNTSVYNNGTSTVNVYLKLDNLVDSGGVTTEPELAVNPADDINDLSNKTYIQINVDGTDKLAAGTTLNSQAGSWVYLGSLSPGATMHVNMSLHIDSATGNAYQGDKSTFDVTFKAFQTNDPNAPY